MSFFFECAEGLARALWALGWADEIEARGGSLSACELTDVAPPTPAEYLAEAARILGRVEHACGGSLAVLHARTAEANGGDAPDADRFGYLLGMQSVGHGVGLGDDYNVPPALARLPHTGCGLMAADYMRADCEAEAEAMQRAERRGR